MSGGGPPWTNPVERPSDKAVRNRDWKSFISTATVDAGSSEPYRLLEPSDDFLIQHFSVIDLNQEVIDYHFRVSVGGLIGRFEQGDGKNPRVNLNPPLPGEGGDGVQGTVFNEGSATGKFRLTIGYTIEP
jgi:hypothetical protein